MSILYRTRGGYGINDPDWAEAATRVPLTRDGIWALALVSYRDPRDRVEDYSVMSRTPAGSWTIQNAFIFGAAETERVPPSLKHENWVPVVHGKGQWRGPVAVLNANRNRYVTTRLGFPAI